MNNKSCSFLTLALAGVVTLLASFGSSSSWAAETLHGPSVRGLFLGDGGHHRPADLFKQLQPAMAQRGIELVYTSDLEDLNPSRLAGFDCLVIFANHTRISPDQERALLEFVDAGGGLVPLHCASYCFLNSPKYIELVGGQFQRHGTGVFKETIVKGDHPIMDGLSPIESWDETYVHTKHNEDRLVLAERRDESGSEPYTWVRERGQGRVFYTAWGHDQRTWSHPGFLQLVERGIQWASEHSGNGLRAREGLKPLEYQESPAPLPNYTRNARWGTQEEPIRTMQKPLSAAESMQRLVTPPGFEVSLFAAEPEILKPIWISWDERGRLWIAETVDYPNQLQREGEGHDRVKICEDTDGDGKADKFTVFADRLSIPTSFVFANGGVIVVHSGRTEFFRDTDGDDKADERKVLFEGWGMRDTHATVSNLRYGFDNWIWGTVGYSGFRGTVGGKELRFGQGIFRFKADGSELEFVRSSNNNTWGLGLTEDGLVFGSTANGNASMYLPIPNRYYEAVRGWSASRLETIADSQSFYPLTEKVRQVDYHGRYTAGSGSAIYTARAFPELYWNRVQFVAEPTGHLLGKFHLVARGTDFVAHNGRNFAASDDEWTAPIAAEVGPDGAIWVSDWYNYIIQHNPTPRGFETGRGAAYETPLRDKVHGRIYRVAHPGSPASRILDLSQAAPQGLVAALKSDNMLWRMHAQRLLVSRGERDVVPALCDLAGDRAVDSIGLNTAAIHALWTLEGLNAFDGASSRATRSAVSALGHPSAAVRRAAALVLPHDEAGVRAILAAKLLEDGDPLVRLAALLALADGPVSREAGAEAFAVLERPENANDRWIPDAAISAAARHDAGFLKAVFATYKPVVDDSKAEAPGNVIPNPSMEVVDGDRPKGWRQTTHSGRGRFGLEEVGRSGKRSVRLSSETGADVSWAVSVPVEPRTDYHLSGWIKTQGVRKLGQARGAMFNVHEMQDPVGGGTPGLVGDNDWTQVHLDFNSGEMRRVTINCLFGGWGRAAGTAWFDDVELTPSAGSVLSGEVGRAVRIVTAHYAQRGPVESIVSTLEGLDGASVELAVPVLDGLVAGWPRGTAPELGAGERERLTDLMGTMPESIRDRLLALSQKWDRPDLFGASIAAILDSVRERIADGAVSDEERIAAAERLAGLDATVEGVRFVLGQITTLSAPALSTGLVRALTKSRAAEAGPVIISRWASFTPAVRRAAIGTLMRRAEWTGALLDAVDEGGIARTELAPEHWSQLKQNPNRRIARRAERLSAASGGISADREEVVAKLLPLAKEKGDAARGRAVFTATCAVCHAFNGTGGKIAPDLTGVGSRDRSEILLDILDPNRSVEANFRLWNLETKDGEIYSGLLATETQTSVEIIDVTGQKHALQRKEISSLQGSALSVMPTGFEALPPEDLTGLLEYLAAPQP